MIGYAEYFRDARIKRYVKSIETSGGSVDVLTLREEQGKKRERVGNCNLFFLTAKYQGQSRIRYVFAYLKYFLACFYRLTALSTKFRYTAVHVHNMPNALVFAAIVPRLRGSRVVLDVHDLMPTTYQVKFGTALDRLIVKALILEQRISAWFSSEVICADHMQKAYLEEVCKVPAAKVTVIMNLPDETLFRPIFPRRRTDSTFRLAYHGTIAERLGIDLILEAVAQIGKEIPVHLSLYGGGSFLPEAIRRAEQLGIRDEVYFSESFFSVESVPELLSGTDVGIIGNRRTPATDSFMMPVKLFEFVQLGIPVVAPRLKIIQSYFGEDMLEYYEPGDTADMARHIVRLYREPMRREQLVRSAARFNEEFGWAGEKKKYLAMLNGWQAQYQPSHTSHSPSTGRENVAEVAAPTLTNGIRVRSAGASNKA
jgi:glycosyltransferase involved in cell wall biosynthesis